VLASQFVFNTQNLRTQTVTQDLQAAKQAEVNIDATFGNLDISSSADNSSLLQGDLRMSNSADIKSSYSVQAGKGSYRLWDAGNYSYPVYMPSSQTGWNISLNTQVPLDLNEHLVMGNQTINLTGINLKTLDSQLVIGKSSLTLPANTTLNGSISGVIGQMDIFVPRGTAVKFQSSSAITVINLPPDYERKGDVITSPGVDDSSATGINLTIEQTIGLINVQYLP
jgi:hypothetical protein